MSTCSFNINMFSFIAYNCRYAGVHRLPASGGSHLADPGGQARRAGRHQVNQGRPVAEDLQGGPRDRQDRVAYCKVQEKTG